MCDKDWSLHRAVLFLDPYGMQVEWATIEAVAKTKAIDLWLLFPWHWRQSTLEEVRRHSRGMACPA